MAKKREVVELTAPDPFLERANEYAGWVEKHLRAIAIAAASALGIFVLVLVLYQQRERKASEITSTLSAAIDGYVDAVDPSETMTSTDTAALKKRAEAAMPSLESIVTENGDHQAAHLARLYLADLARRAGDHARAEQLFKEYAAKSKSDDPLMFVALEGAGYALEEQKKLDDALQYFVKLYELPGKELDDLALKHQARVYEEKGDREAALKTYKQLIEQFPESKLRDFADQRVGALE
jgi:tetratricopeptide (TPR) repeat protein